MRRRNLLTALAITATVTAMMTVGSAGGAGRTIGLPDCSGRLSVRPSSIVLACADANFRLQKLQWTGWGEALTAARSTALVNDCTPNCAAGHFHSYPVLVMVSGHQTCSHGPAYTSLVYAFPAAAPFHP